MKAYKAFSKDGEKIHCRGHYFELGKTYKHEGELKMCESGFHACTVLADVFDYYSFDMAQTTVGEVEIDDESLSHDSDSKRCSGTIKILRLLSWEEVLKSANSGYRNSGDSNSGYRNSGDSNSGSWNSGDRNSGSWNSGDSNSGDRNSGHQNSGYRNSGDSNSGSWNSGYWNSGDRNSGSWNSGDRNSGFLNSNKPKMIYIFNKLCPKSRWDKAEIPQFFYFELVIWIDSSRMTDQEKVNHESHKTTGGYLKIMGYKEAWQYSWNSADPNNRELVRKLPNFSAKVFYEVSGIDLRKQQRAKKKKQELIPGVGKE